MRPLPHRLHSICVVVWTNPPARAVRDPQWPTITPSDDNQFISDSRGSLSLLIGLQAKRRSCHHNSISGESEHYDKLFSLSKPKDVRD